LTATTDGQGIYAITRPAGAVQTNRSWRVSAATLQSTERHQRVRALITLSASAPTADTGAAETLSGHVTPSHAAERVKIEQRQGSAWKVVARPVLDSGSNFHTRQIFRSGGQHVLRAVLNASKKNAQSASTPVPIQILSGIHKIQHVVIIMQ